MSIMANSVNTNLAIGGSLTRAINVARATFLQIAQKKDQIIKALNSGIDNVPFLEELLTGGKLTAKDRKDMLTKVFIDFDKLKAKDQQRILLFLDKHRMGLFAPALNNLKAANPTAFKGFLNKLVESNKVSYDFLNSFINDEKTSPAPTKEKQNPMGIGYSQAHLSQLGIVPGKVDSKGSNQSDSPIAKTIMDQITKMAEILEEGLETLKNAALDKSKLKALSATPESFIQGYRTLEKLVKSL